LIPAQRPFGEGPRWSDQIQKGENKMGLFFLVGAIVVAVVGIMAMAVAEPYKNNPNKYSG
jgi:hypothetical protein